jgi:hypothetical protein
MATLVLKEFRAVEETDEVGSDSPYFLIFRGRPNNPTASTVDIVRFGSWDNEIDSGDFRTVNFAVGTGVDAGTVVLVALMEEDVDPNFTSSNQAMKNVRGWMKTALQAWGANGATVDQVASSLTPEFAKAINANRGNDDIVSIQQLKITTLSGQLGLLHMKGDGGYYRVRFTMA